MTWTVADGNGNTDVCSVTITVEDNEAPEISCPADIVSGTNGGNCGAVVAFPTPAGFDNCGIASLVQTMGFPSGSVFPVGETIIEFTATDVNGNVATCNFTVTITDDDSPIVVCQDITLLLDSTGTATIVASDLDGGSTDNCGITNLEIDIDTFTCADLGPNTVTLTATDGQGLSSSCTAIVTVENGLVPTVLCQDVSLELDAFGMVSITDASIFDGGSVDACGGTNLTFSVSPSNFTCDDLGENTVTFTATDANGNTSTCTAILTVEDVTAPTVSCMDLTVSLDENGEASIDPSDLLVLADDACGIDTVMADIVDFNCDDVGTAVSLTVMVTDSSGNAATCTATVTVVDEFAPVLDCPTGLTVQITAGTPYEVEDFIASGAVAVADNCGGPVTLVSQSPAVGDLLDSGVHPVSITVADAWGNETSCTFDITVDSVLSIEESGFDISSLAMYPNPASDFVQLSNPENIPLEAVSIYDITGRLVKKLDASRVTSQMTIAISELASATYFFLIKTADQQITYQIIKE